MYKSTDYHKEHMGLTTWKNALEGKGFKSDEVRAQIGRSKK